MAVVQDRCNYPITTPTNSSGFNSKSIDHITRSGLWGTNKVCGKPNLIPARIIWKESYLKGKRPRFRSTKMETLINYLKLLLLCSIPIKGVCRIFSCYIASVDRAHYSLLN